MAIDPRNALDVVRSICLDGGQILREAFYGRWTAPHEDTPTADHQVEDLLYTQLSKHFPDSGFRAEERPERNRRPRTGCTDIWLVDPHDGTTAAEAGYRGASISVALIRDGRPVLGVVYAYAFPNDSGDLIEWALGMPAVRRNGQDCVGRDASSPRLTLVSRHVQRREESYLSVLGEYRFMGLPGIAYRLARVAAGLADGAISLNPPRDFDLAGGHALLIGAGLTLVDYEGADITYDGQHMRRHQACFAGARHITAALRAKDWTEVLSSDSRIPTIAEFVEPDSRQLVSNPAILARAQGAWLGQLIGDALGSQVESKTRGDIELAFPDGVQDILDGGTFNTLGGQPTDDSEMAIVLARSLLQQGGYDEAHVLTRYREWYESEPFDIGQTVATALAAAHGLDAVRSAREAANGASQANGALMRCAPIGLFGVRSTSEQTADNARKDAELTHPNSICVDANIMFALTLRAIIRQGLTGHQAHQFARDVIHERRLSPLLNEWLKASSEGPPTNYVHQMGWVKIALQNAFYHLQHTDSFLDALSQTVGQGGDTDTNACILGALKGAVDGLNSIPEQWIGAVTTCRPSGLLAATHHPRPRHYWPVDALNLAERLVGGPHE